MDRTSRCNKIYAVRLYASYRLNLLAITKGAEVRDKYTWSLFIWRLPISQFFGCHCITVKALQSKVYLTYFSKFSNIWLEEYFEENAKMFLKRCCNHAFTCVGRCKHRVQCAYLMPRTVDIKSMIIYSFCFNNWQNMKKPWEILSFNSTLLKSHFRFQTVHAPHAQAQRDCSRIYKGLFI